MSQNRLSWLSIYFIKFQRELTERHILASLPGVDTTLDIMLITGILSERGTKPLGDFEIEYAMDPVSLSTLKRYSQGNISHFVIRKIIILRD